MVNNKMKTMLLIVLGIMLICSNAVMAVDAWIKDYSLTRGTSTQNPGDTPYSYAYTTGNYGHAWASSMCYPEEGDDGTDESSTSLNGSSKELFYTYVGCNLTYTTFDFEVKYDVTWNVGGNSNNDRLSAGTTAASGELSVSVDAEPDDPDADDNDNSRWDGEKTEKCSITGFGISVWGASLSWDDDGGGIFGDDDWSDSNSGSDPTTTTWDGTLDNETSGGTLLGIVSLDVEADLDSSCSGDTYAWNAYTGVNGSLATLDLNLE